MSDELVRASLLAPTLRLAWDDHQKVANVRALIEHARKISPSDRMPIYVGDLEHALGLRDERARTRTGSNGA